MKKLVLLFTLLATAQVGATHYDVIYRFDTLVADSDDYFVMKIDFDALAPEGYISGDYDEVSSYEEFADAYFNFDGNLPVFYFEFIIIDTNMNLALNEIFAGSTSITATISPMITGIEFAPASFLATGFLPVDAAFFPTGWELGTNLGNELFDSDTGHVTEFSFTLTEITPVPLPAALPLFGCALLLLTGLTRP